MGKSRTIHAALQKCFSARASLVAVGTKLQRLGVLQPLAGVHIAQKQVKYTPVEKLQDGLVTIMAGGHGLVEVNKRLRNDWALPRAFGRQGCAEQSVVQDTLDACTAENVTQMEAATEAIYRQWSRGAQHDYQARWQLLDIDLTGRPCGPKAAFASRGYFAEAHYRYGRQVGYVLATHYGEIVLQRLFEGRTQLSRALPTLLQAAQSTLSLSAEQRQRTIVRVDAGGGSEEDINWVLGQGYHFCGKDYSGPRGRKLVETVSTWYPDPKDPDRESGWVTAPATPQYLRPVWRVAVRCRKKNGHHGLGVIVTDLPPEEVLSLSGQDPSLSDHEPAVLWAYVTFYDQRGGGVETAIKNDKQGLGTRKRNKKRFAAQQVVLQLETLAHNLLVWVKHWLLAHCPFLPSYGLLRLVRDILTINGRITLDPSQGVLAVTLSQDDPLTKALVLGLAPLLAGEQVLVISGEI